MPRRTRIVIAVLTAVGVAFLLVGLYGVVRAEQAPSAAAVDPAAISSAEIANAPTFDGGPTQPVTGRTLDGEPLALAAFAGRPVVLSFWATWCEPCRRELPALAAWAKAHPEVAIVGVNYEDDAAAAKAFASEHGATWPSLADADGAIGEAFKVPGLPATYLIDADGRVVDRILGEVTGPVLDAHLKALGA